MKLVIFISKLIIFILIGINCTPRSTNYQSGSLETTRALYRMMPQMIYDQPLTSEKEEREKEHDLDRYKTILEQTFEFNPPITILLIIPPQSRYNWWYYGNYGTYNDSLKSMIIHALKEKLVKT
ncbi:MAG: hypothetical protein WBB37_08095, partial [bacterium]